VQKGKKGKGEKGKEKRPVIFYITRGGHELAKRISGLYPDAELLKFNTSVFAGKWQDAENIICIMATGIVVRAMASLLKDKKTDPAVVVLDERGKYAVSVVGGHLGGANSLAQEIADYLGAYAVITTASDVQGKIALDLWAREKNLYIEDFEKLKKLSARIVNGKKIRVHSDCPCDAEQMPDEFIMVKSKDESDIIISHRILDSTALFLRPGNLFVGIGCNRGTPREEIEEMTRSVFEKERLSFNSIRSIGTIDLKSDEQGLIDFAGANKINIEFFSKDDLNNAALKHKIEESEAVKAATGAVAVAEPAAILSAKKISERYSIMKRKEKRGT
jgi:cobalamin biosynthesis protein CbiG